MTGKGTILVGTVGQGVMMSADDGESWTRAGVRQGLVRQVGGHGQHVVSRCVGRGDDHGTV